MACDSTRVYGELPSNYRPTTLGEVCEAGGIQTGPFGSQLHKEDYVVKGTPIVTVEHLGENRFTHQNLPMVSDADVARLERYRLKSGDIVFSRVGSVDRRAIVRDEEDGWLFSGRCLRVRPRRDLIDPLWLSYLFGTVPFREHIRAVAVGATMPSINTKILSDAPIFVPPLKDQIEVATTLGAIDDRIDNLRQANATLEAIAQALFKSWFVDFGPVRAKAEGREPEGMDATTAALFPSECEDSEIGPIPKGWNLSSLGEICSANGGLIQTGPFGSQLHASDYADEGVPLVMPQDLAARRIQTERIARVPEETAQRLARHRLLPGDIVFSRRGDVGRHALVDELESGWLCGTGCLLVRPALTNTLSGFISCALARSESLEWLVRHAVGATMPNLNTKILSALPMLSAPAPVVHAFEAIAGPIECRVSANNALAQALASIRDTLLPRLISGKLRLTEAEARVHEVAA